MKQQKQFFGIVVKKFAQAFKAQTGKIVKVLKAKEEKQKNLPLQLPAPLQKPRLCNFFGKNSG